MVPGYPSIHPFPEHWPPRKGLCSTQKPLGFALIAFMLQKTECFYVTDTPISTILSLVLILIRKFRNKIDENIWKHARLRNKTSVYVSTFRPSVLSLSLLLCYQWKALSLCPLSAAGRKQLQACFCGFQIFHLAGVWRNPSPFCLLVQAVRRRVVWTDSCSEEQGHGLDRSREVPVQGHSSAWEHYPKALQWKHRGHDWLPPVLFTSLRNSSSSQERCEC